MSPAPASALGRWISIDGDDGIVRFVGPVDGTSGTWLGVEWANPERGKHDGSKDGKQYFTCKSKGTNSGSFIRCVDRIDWGQTLLEAARSRYITDTSKISTPSTIDGRRGKIEAVGFDKIANEQSDLLGLTVLGLDSLRVYELGPCGVMANVRSLSLARNYLTGWQQVGDILAAFPNVDTLDISANHIEGPVSLGAGLGVHTLRVDSSPGLTWAEVGGFVDHVGARSLSFGWSELSQLESSAALGLLEDLKLEYNHLSDITSLASLPRLRSLSLRGNQEFTEIPVIHESMFPSLESLHLGHTGVSQWLSVDHLGQLPKLRTLYLAHTPVASESHTSHAMVIGRLANITKLDGSLVSPEERTEMERYYLVLSTQLEDELPRLAELIAKHGRPRRPVAIDAKIKSRLAQVSIHVVRRSSEEEVVTKSLLKSMLVRQLHLVVARLAKSRDFQLYVTSGGQWTPLDCDTRELSFYGVEDGSVICAVLQ
ncbi:hypothetical protein IW152_003842 [Coemansia sp. BCRC 34962]|nr:hypothetical protein IW152_003842 [Coemansia sp. BCRC 34962]